jgi:hypothetical protein
LPERLAHAPSTSAKSNPAKATPARVEKAFPLGRTWFKIGTEWLSLEAKNERICGPFGNQGFAQNRGICTRIWHGPAASSGLDRRAGLRAAEICHIGPAFAPMLDF